MNKGDFMTFVDFMTFLTSRGVLCHKDKVEGLPICQRCVPQSQYVHKLKLAYNSASDCHLRVCETPERCQLLCYWHGVCQDMHSLLGRVLRGDYGPDRQRPTLARRPGR